MEQYENLQTEPPARLRSEKFDTNVGVANDDDRRRIESQRIKMVRFLLKRGAKTQMPGIPEWASPSHIAARLQRNDIVEILSGRKL